MCVCRLGVFWCCACSCVESRSAVIGGVKQGKKQWRKKGLGVVSEPVFSNVRRCVRWVGGGRSFESFELLCCRRRQAASVVRVALAPDSGEEHRRGLDKIGLGCPGLDEWRRDGILWAASICADGVPAVLHLASAKVAAGHVAGRARPLATHRSFDSTCGPQRHLWRWWESFGSTDS